MRHDSDYVLGDGLYIKEVLQFYKPSNFTTSQWGVKKRSSGVATFAISFVSCVFCLFVCFIFVLFWHVLLFWLCGGWGQRTVAALTVDWRLSWWHTCISCSAATGQLVGQENCMCQKCRGAFPQDHRFWSEELCKVESFSYKMCGVWQWSVD